MSETVAQAQQRYMAALHAMQSGVAAEMQLDPTPSNPKHLRVGVNSALVSHSALVRLLIDKGVITEPEWFTALANAMEQEVKTYEERLSDHYGSRVHLS